MQQAQDLVLEIKSFLKMPSIRQLKQRDNKQRELRLYYLPYMNADEEKEQKRKTFEVKVQEYALWCKNNAVNPEYDPEVIQATTKANIIINN